MECNGCGATILFGGVPREDGMHFCNARCASRNAHTLIRIPDAEVTRIAEQIEAGPCPQCGRPGPIHAHRARWIASIFFFTSIGGEPTLCCRVCARKSRVICAISSSMLGWWSVPVGVVATPFIVGSNLLGLIRPAKTIDETMLHLVRKDLALAAQRDQSTHLNSSAVLADNDDDVDASRPFENAATIVRPFPSDQSNPELPEVTYQTDWLTLDLEVTRPQLECSRLIHIQHNDYRYPFQLHPDMKRGQLFPVDTGNRAPIRVRLRVV